ncbi:MAG: 5-oxoprolinase subunit PxpB [Deltaproteobacteria bacterium]|nr:5-oxoprolinase subunit PxpB [Deltaproteobacteria bacterium]
MGHPKILPCGDSAVAVEFGSVIDPLINREVYALFNKLKAEPPLGLIDLIPTYRSLLVQYDPTVLSFKDLQKIVFSFSELSGGAAETVGRLVEIPVCYGNAYGPDLKVVADYLHLTEEEIIEIHSKAVYQVYMIGFTPGFPYLGGLDPRLFAPRKKVPRELVPAGTVGIADQQTGIYPIDSPGGWQLIGRTPIKLFDLDREEVFYLKPGDRVKFNPISEEEFEHH